jgi:hypothetical protein
MALEAIQISLVGMGVPAFQREFRITPYLSAVSSVTPTTLTRGELRNRLSSSWFLRRRPPLITGGKLKATELYLHSSTAMKRQGDAPPCLINRGRMIIFTRGFVILSQSTKHLQPAMDFLISAP